MLGQKMISEWRDSFCLHEKFTMIYALFQAFLFNPYILVCPHLILKQSSPIFYLVSREGHEVGPVTPGLMLFHV